MSALAALREWSAALPDEMLRDELVEKCLRGFALGDGFKPRTFETFTRRIEAADLTPRELELLMRKSWKSGVLPEETGEWIDWLGRNFQVEKAGDRVHELIEKWTRTNYQAAGKWLVSAPESPARNTAIRAYAETVAICEPQTAAQWATTLPPGKDRDDTLKHIYHAWPEKDEAAKGAFAKEHGLK